MNRTHQKPLNDKTFLQEFDQALSDDAHARTSFLGFLKRTAMEDQDCHNTSMFCTDIGNDLGLDKDGYMDSMRKLNAPHGRITLHCDVINLIARAHNENWRAGHLWMNGVKAMNHKIAMVVYVPNYKTVSESWITLNGQPLHKSSMKKRLVIKPPVSLQDVVGVAGAYSVLHRDPDKVPKNYRQFMITGATGNLLTVRHIQEKLSRIFYVGEEAFSFFSDWRIHVERSAKQHQREESIRQTIREEAHRETIAGPDFRHSFGGQVGDRDHQIGGKRQTYGGSGNVFNINTDTARPMQDLATNQDADLPSTPAPPPTSPSAAVFKGLTLYRYDHKGKVLPMHDTGVELDISEESLALWKEGNDIKPFCRIPLGSIQRCQFKDGKTHVRLDFIVTLVLDGVAKDEVNRISVSAGDAGRAANLKGAIEKAMENYRTSIPSPISSIGGPPSPISPLASGSDVERSTATDAALTRDTSTKCYLATMKSVGMTVHTLESVLGDWFRCGWAVPFFLLQKRQKRSLPRGIFYSDCWTDSLMEGYFTLLPHQL